ncbi:MAG: patatin-like phospholipase family protein, partial [Marinobacter sp.]|uniref:patatin-like phospholipase family protein n=1 Tax=Marinobacter sp. TaxID=50741 RepID=UPI00299E27CB
EVDFAAVSQAIRENRLSAVGVNACGYSTGQNVCFFDGREGLASWNQGQRAGCRTSLELSHVMASAAIPTVFPPVLIHREYFGDGVTRQMAHVSPALRLGAERVLVIGVSANQQRPPERPGKPMMPGFGQIFAHVFNGMFLDTLDYDIDRLRLVNQLLDLVPPERLQAANLELKPVRLLEISPSEPLDELAARYIDGLPAVLRKLTGVQPGKGSPGASLASYLLFDHRFCQALIKLGYQDAQRQSRQIDDFFSDSAAGP